MYHVVGWIEKKYKYILTLMLWLGVLNSKSFLLHNLATKLSLNFEFLSLNFEFLRCWLNKS